MKLYIIADKDGRPVNYGVVISEDCGPGRRVCGSGETPSGIFFFSKSNAEKHLLDLKHEDDEGWLEDDQIRKLEGWKVLEIVIPASNNVDFNDYELNPFIREGENEDEEEGED